MPGQMVGFVRLDCGPDRIADVTLVVAPAWRRRGLGRSMGEAALRQARELGLRQLVAIVDRENVAALALFDALGFGAEGLLGDRLRLVRLVHAGHHQAPLEIDV
jgi:ribosomal protein S18 acetylase RimI-like enzyme